MKINKAFTADGDSPIITWLGGTATFICFGGGGNNFGGGTITPMLSLDGTNYAPAATGKTAAGLGQFSAPAGSLIKLTLTGSTAPTVSGQLE